MVFPKTDGEILSSTEVNKLILHRKKFSDATERSTTNTSYEDSGTSFTLSIAVDSVITKIVISMDLNNTDNGQYSDVALKLNGSNLGSLFVKRNVATEGRFIAQDLLIGSSETTLFRTTGSDTAYGASFIGECYSPLVILDATTTITVRIKTEGNVAALVKNVTVDVLYKAGFKED